MRTPCKWLSLLMLTSCANATSATDTGPGGQSYGGDSSGGQSASTGGQSPASGGQTSSGGSSPSAGSGGVIGTGGTTGSGGSTASGGAATGGAGGRAPASKCEHPVGPGLPAGAPSLTVGTWKDISPPSVDYGNGPFTQGMAIDPCNPAVLYITSCAFDVSLGGLFKSTDAGGTWRRIGRVGNGYLDEPIRVRVDPKNTQHLYVGDGVRGATTGFFVSTDGGETFTLPDSFVALKTTENMYQYDVYDVAADPTDFNHVLVSFHAAWGWTDTKWNASAGVLESKDGGATWIVHPPSGWGYGHAINFLYNPDLGIGDANTWLLGTQGGGMLRTTDAGATWTKVSDIGIQHGGGTLYYAKNGKVYASGGDRNLRSTDNGATWTQVGPGGGYNGIGGDGTKIYTAKCFGPTPMITTPESDGVNWTSFNSQSFDSGSFQIEYDAVNSILYTASWGSGMWALKTK